MRGNKRLGGLQWEMNDARMEPVKTTGKDIEQSAQAMKQASPCLMF